MITIKQAFLEVLESYSYMAKSWEDIESNSINYTPQEQRSRKIRWHRAQRWSDNLRKRIEANNWTLTKNDEQMFKDMCENVEFRNNYLQDFLTDVFDRTEEEAKEIESMLPTRVLNYVETMKYLDKEHGTGEQEEIGEI